jgi:hypothetical protein
LQFGSATRHAIPVQICEVSTSTLPFENQRHRADDEHECADTA